MSFTDLGAWFDNLVLSGQFAEVARQFEGFQEGRPLERTEGFENVRQLTGAVVSIQEGQGSTLSADYMNSAFEADPRFRAALRELEIVDPFGFLKRVSQTLSSYGEIPLSSQEQRGATKFCQRLAEHYLVVAQRGHGQL